MLPSEVADLYRYWAKTPPAHESVRLALYAWGVVKAPEDEAPKPSITDDEVAMVAALRAKWGSA